MINKVFSSCKVGFFTLITLITNSFLYSQSATITPSISGSFCPNVANQRTFVFTLTNIASDDVELKNAYNLVVVDQFSCCRSISN